MTGFSSLPQGANNSFVVFVMMLFSCSKKACGKHPANTLVLFKTIFFWSRQQLSLGDIETASEFCCTAITDYLHPLLTSFFGCKLGGCFFPLQWEVKEHLLAHGCLIHCLACLHTALAHRAGSILGTHQVHIWLRHPLSGSQIQCGQRYQALQGCSGALLGWRWLVGMRIANYVLLPGTVAWENCEVQNLLFIGQ